jgi:hypothetical protein
MPCPSSEEYSNQSFCRCPYQKRTWNTCDLNEASYKSSNFHSIRTASVLANVVLWPIADVPIHPKTHPVPRALCGRNRVAVAHRVRARMARCSTRGPCAAVSRGRQAAERESTRMSTPFRQGQESCRKARPPAHGFAAHGEGMDARVEATQERLVDGRQAPSGVAFLFG